MRGLVEIESNGTEMTASCHHIRSHSHIQAQVVNQFQTAQSIQGQKETGEGKRDRHRSREGDTEQTF